MFIFDVKKAKTPYCCVENTVPNVLSSYSTDIVESLIICESREQQLKK